MCKGRRRTPTPNLYRPDGTPLELLRQQGGATSRYWYVVDGRSNVIALTDLTGRVVDAYAYDAWGQPVGAYETVAQPFRYGGYWYDAALGWYWVSVRPYDPALKRWLQPDPSAQDGVRTYVYVGDDPVDATDPSGLSATPPPCSAYTNHTVCEQSPTPPPSGTPTPGTNGGTHQSPVSAAVPFRGDTKNTWRDPDGELRMAYEDVHVDPADAKFPGAHVNLQLFRKYGRSWKIEANWHVRLGKPQQLGRNWVKVTMEAGDNYHNLQTEAIEGQGNTLEEALANGKRQLATRMAELMEEKGLISVAERNAVFDGLAGELEDVAVTGAEEAGAGLLGEIIDVLLSSLILN